ncbi:helix-turn-helix transcriptional regulator [Streptomyces sp. Amel2xB2]|uniref:helix-turn-helix transcriptional regulator n=1 Tax=Streptomyces sp. Amel2xB2 TaxID=1305829 RepID=UPI000DBAAD6E|nr:helix-turn-helix domain-containing protein [Streptomyces sp. Amel2xB2]
MPPTDPLPPWVLHTREAVGVRVRELRTERGYSQERLGELAGLDRKTINRIEVAAYGTSLDHLTMIARALDAPLASLFS